MKPAAETHALLVTGAGASRDLGRDDPMPLMDDWASYLVEALDERETGLADAVDLRVGMSSEEFEETIGALLRWDEVRELRDRFRGLSAPVPAQQHTWAQEGKQREVERMRSIIDVINQTLYRLFRADRIDDATAAAAYAELFEALGQPRRITVVTTNYDPGAERALYRLPGRMGETGFDRQPGGDGYRFDVSGLIDRAGRDIDRGLTPVLHLHGAVGWYERDGNVWEHPPVDDYNPSLGRPVVLYPDPDKDPTRDKIVAAVWGEFRAAIAAADFVVVIGHSLNDRPLCDELRGIKDKPVLVGTFVEPGEAESVGNEAGRVRDLLGGNNLGVVPMRFGRPGYAEFGRLRTWIASIR